MVERTLHITLPDDLANAVEAKVEAGQYGSTDDVMKAAVGALLREEDNQDERLEAIRQRVRKSLNDPRPSLSGAQVQKRLEELYARHKG